MDGVQNWRLKLNRAENWQRVYAGLHQKVEGQTRYPLIPAFELPTLIQSNILAVMCRNINAPVTWRRAGWLNQAVTNFNPDQPIFSNEPWIGLDTSQKLINLNNSQLIVFPSFTQDYYLWFEPVKWLPKLFLTVWAYTGDIDDKYLNEMEALKVDLARIEFQIQELR